MTKFSDGKQIRGCQELGMMGNRGTGVTMKGEKMGYLCGDEILVYLDRDGGYTNLYM